MAKAFKEVSFLLSPARQQFPLYKWQEAMAQKSIGNLSGGTARRLSFLISAASLRSFDLFASMASP
ncbi:hypothetical protein GCM10009415_18420 [Chitinophaga japonensis]